MWAGAWGGVLVPEGMSVRPAMETGCAYGEHVVEVHLVVRGGVVRHGVGRSIVCSSRVGKLNK